MQAALGLSRAIDRLTELVGRGVSWLVLAAVLVSAGNAVIRKTFDLSSNAWLELQWYLFGAVFMLAASYALQKGDHVRIDVLYAGLSRRKQHWIDLFGHLVFLAPFTLLMTWYLVPYFLFAFRSGEISANAGGLPIWPGKLMLLLGFILLTLQTVSEIVKKIAVMRGQLPDPAAHAHTGEQHAE
jgi:TRAP-type mannitol/chloroaromatic compound transport system permease small subunit